jgi:hypothetical protein
MEDSPREVTAEVITKGMIGRRRDVKDPPNGGFVSPLVIEPNVPHPWDWDAGNEIAPCADERPRL